MRDAERLHPKSAKIEGVTSLEDLPVRPAGKLCLYGVCRILVCEDREVCLFGQTANPRGVVGVLVSEKHGVKFFGVQALVCQQSRELFGGESCIH